MFLADQLGNLRGLGSLQGELATHLLRRGEASLRTLGTEFIILIKHLVIFKIINSFLMHLMHEIRYHRCQKYLEDDAAD
jgi:hypothetical protein